MRRPMSALLWAVVVSSTLAWALFDVLRKRLAAKMPIGELALWLSVAQLPFYAAWWLAAVGWVLPPELALSDYLVPALVSVVFNVVANLLFLSAVAAADLGATIPLLSLTPVFVALGSIPILGERLEPRNWLGIVLVSAGAMLLGDKAGHGLRARVVALVRSRSSSFMVMTAALWALTPVCDKVALRHVAVPVHAAFLALGVGLGTGLVLWLKRAPLPRPKWGAAPVLLGAGAVNVLALGLQFVAISSVVVSVFEAFKRAMGLLLALAFGTFFFRERPTALRLAAGAVMAVGVLLVLLPAG